MLVAVMVQVKVHVDVLVLGAAHKMLPLAGMPRRRENDDLILGHIRTDELVSIAIEIAQVVSRNAIRHGEEALTDTHLRRIQQLNAQQALGLAVTLGQALEHVKCDMAAVSGRMPLGNSLRRGGRIVGIALATGHSCQIEQHADVVLGSPLNRAVDVIDNRDVGGIGLL